MTLFLKISSAAFFNKRTKFDATRVTCVWLVTDYIRSKVSIFNFLYKQEMIEYMWPVAMHVNQTELGF